MRKFFRTAAIGWVLPFFLCVGCGTGQKPIRVSIFTTDPTIIKILNNAITNIESRHPGLKIELENIPYNSYQDKLTVEMAAGNAPDVIGVEVNNFVDLYLRGALENLSPYFQADGMDSKAYYPTALKRFSPGGSIYALPTDIAPFGMVYYNKKLFDEAGVPYPTSDWSWPEPFLSICQKLVKRDASGKIIQWAYADPYGTTADNFMLSNGGYYADSEENPTRMALDSPAVLVAFRFRWDLIWTYHVSPTPSDMQNYNFGSGAEPMFMNGVLAMMDSGLWHTPNFLQTKGLSFDVVEFPEGPKGKRGWGSGGSGFAVWNGGKNKQIAWMVVKELAADDAVSQVTATGMAQPALLKVAQSDVFLKSPGPLNKKILLDMPKYSHYAPFVKDWPEIWNGQVGPALDPVWLGEKKPEDVLPKINAEINRKYFGIQ